MLKINNGSAGDIVIEHISSSNSDKSVGIRITANGVPTTVLRISKTGRVLSVDHLKPDSLGDK